MSTIPHADSDERSDQALESVVGCRRHVNTANADVWEYVAAFCDVAAAKEEREPATGFVHTWAYGGPGTPLVPESAVVEIGAEVGESRQAAARLVAVSMNLAHRMPRILHAVMLGDVDWRKAELVATGTLHLTEQVVADVQDLLLPVDLDPTASLLARITRPRLQDVISQVQLVADEEAVEQDVEAALADRDVRIGRADRWGVTEIAGTLSTEDGARLASRLRQVAGWLRETGDDRPSGVRRSAALGILADPARLQELWDDVRAHRARTRSGASTEDDGTADRDCGDPDGADLDALPPTPPAGIPGTRLFVHLDRDSDTWTLDGTSASDPCAGVLSRAEARRLVGHDRVSLTPVIDLATELSYTGYKAPPRLRMQLAMRNHGVCVFPSCTRGASVPDGSSSVDYDHAPAWPEGTTCSTDGAILCESNHRDRTFNGWTRQQAAPGIWVWRSRDGRYFLVTAGTTTPITL